MRFLWTSCRPYPAVRESPRASIRTERPRHPISDLQNLHSFTPLFPPLKYSSPVQRNDRAPKIADDPCFAIEFPILFFLAFGEVDSEGAGGRKFLLPHSPNSTRASKSLLLPPPQIYSAPDTRPFFVPLFQSLLRKARSPLLRAPRPCVFLSFLGLTFCHHPPKT